MPLTRVLVVAGTTLATTAASSLGQGPEPIRPQLFMQVQGGVVPPAPGQPWDPTPGGRPVGWAFPEMTQYVHGF